MEISYSDRRSSFSYILCIIIIGGILILFIYITRLASKEIFSPSNKIHREVGRAKDLSATLYFRFYFPIIGSVCESWTAPHGRLCMDVRVVPVQLLDTAEVPTVWRCVLAATDWLLRNAKHSVYYSENYSICIWINPLQFLEPEIYLFLYKFRLVSTKYNWKRLTGNIRFLNHSTRWRSRKVAGSVPDGVIRIFHWLKPSGLNMFTNINEYQGDKCGRCVGLTALQPSCVDNVEKSASLHRLKASPSLCRYSLESKLNHSLPLALCVPKFACFDLFHCWNVRNLNVIS